MSGDTFNKVIGGVNQGAQNLNIDRALSAKRDATTRGFDPLAGKLVEGFQVNGDTKVPHTLRKQPKGAFLLRGNGQGELLVKSATVDHVLMWSNGLFTDVAIWVV